MKKLFIAGIAAFIAAGSANAAFVYSAGPAYAIIGSGRGALQSITFTSLGNSTLSFTGFSSMVSDSFSDAANCPMRCVNFAGGTYAATTTPQTITYGAGSGFALLELRVTGAPVDVNLSGLASFIAGEVPEPASWAMMISGFGAVGASMRRRKTAVHFA